MSILTHLPETVKKLLALEAWVVGSGATNKLQSKDIRDIDIMVPWPLWNKLAPMIPSHASPTSLGGWRWTEDKVVIDVWPDSLERLTTSALFKASWHPVTNTILRKLNE